jgi:copper(I)-binding protein
VIVKRIMSMLVALTVTVAACGGGGSIEIDDAWARTSAGMQNAGAVYMTVSGGDETDRLVGASVDTSVAAMIEVHETTMGDDGTMTMQEVPGVDIPAGGSVSLEPGGYHIMLMQLAEPLETGDEFTVTLTFENAGEVEVPVEVRDS